MALRGFVFQATVAAGIYHPDGLDPSVPGFGVARKLMQIVGWPGAGHARSTHTPPFPAPESLFRSLNT